MTKPMMPRDASGNAVQALRPMTAQNLNFTSTSAATSAVVTRPVLRLISTQDCYIKLSSSPTAAAGDMMLKAGVPEIIRANPNVDKVAAIRVSADGILNITELG